MRYPKQWKADGQSVYASSSKTKNTERVYTLTLYVDRPGTPDHTRRIQADMNYAQLEHLYKQLTYQMSIKDKQLAGQCYGESFVGN